ncbi:MAG TPA: DUF4982 domain-containing protein, partial [Prolixibacteraceae bacterium]|nr:DUF4982 domain-containing protein [Prolixibacteraceae bacterium]
LDICDRLGMLVIDENRLMGTSEMHLDYLRRLIERDRNHPSVILWSIGNEEWAIEGNERGADMAASMQAFARSIDPTRPVNAAISGGWGQGISTVIEVMGYNYLNHGDTDQHHERFPGQSSLGTEEGSTNTTRGIYFDDPEKQYLAAYDRPTPSGFLSYHTSWNHYASRDYLAGVCYWTGFDYRGESTPFGWPSVSSYFGIFDLCGFPKDNYYYLKSWWSREPVLHILPHWNWPGKEGDEVDVVVYSNFDEVELYRNGQSQGKKTMEKNGSLMWKVPYQPGELKALGYKNGILTGEKRVVTSSEPASLALSADRTRLKADRQDVSVISVSLTDAMGNPVPNANIPVSFSVEGPGKIIGVGNGDPTSHENDRFIEKALSLSFGPWKEIPADETRVEEALQPGYNDATWERAFPRGSNEPGVQPVKKIYRSHFSLSADDLEAKISWMFNSIGKEQSVYVNGKLLGKNLGERERNHTFVLNREILHVGENTVAIVAIPYVKAHQWDNVNTRPGLVQILIPAPRWERSTFNGLAQVLLQTGDTKGIIVLKANAGGLNPASITLVAE